MFLLLVRQLYKPSICNVLDDVTSNILFSFDKVTVEGNAHLAILSDTRAEDIDIRSNKLLGDRTGVMHIGRRQTYGYTTVDTYLPINIMSYK